MKGTFTDQQVIKVVEEIAIPIHANKGPGSEVFNRCVKLSGNYSIPAFFYIKPDGTEMTELRKMGTISAEDFVDKLKTAAKTVGKGIGKKDYDKAKESFKKGAEALAKEKYKDAVKELTAIAKGKAKDGAIGQSAKDELTKIEQVGRAKMDEAAKHEEAKEWKEAHKLYTFVADEFVGLEVAKTAKEALSKLTKNPEAVEALKKK